ncbi:probable metal-nicotianamine transporter YSL8 [Salvia miltiorrhiza]|uniref:probable metal-nicotianamine transporter YSL8 n=1 Tax=Salvia miltiorrhiza TaxID=226208 RepID=UPI0025ABF18D|nr:probable metal-nicotianamine transporter YSL8 [Salvia miltiorrhiza]
MFSFIVMKLNLTTGIIPSLNVAAGLLGFFFVKISTKLLDTLGLSSQPFTRQENTVIQTCVVAASGIAYSGGFGSYLFAMSELIVHQSEPSSSDYKNPKLGWMIGFLFVVSFLGLFSLVPLRKMMIIDFKLTYPSGTATAHLINSFHTPQGAKLAKKQVRELGKFFSLSFMWSFFQWFFTAGNDCGFQKFPTFGLQALQHKFYFDFSATYIGVGMICPHIVNISLLIGGILSWGIMWPLIQTRKGHWYSADLDPSDIQALKGYQVFIAIALILGDGLYNFGKVLSQTIAGMTAMIIQRRNPQLPTGAKNPLSSDDERRTAVFLKDQIPTSLAVGGYVAIAAVSTATLPHIFPHLRWYHAAVIYVSAPALAFCNAFGAGLTDWSLASAYGKLAIFTVGAWAGASQSHGGALAGLAACGVMMNIVSTASDLMQDFKTGYMTLASPRSMFASQAAGTAMGCVVAPCVFWVFYAAFPLGDPGGEYPAPFAVIYYEMAKLGVGGFSELPRNCLSLCYGFFAAAVAINLVRDGVGGRGARFVPLPMAMAVPFYLGSYFAVDMCVGSLILYVWQRRDRAAADALAPAVASGLICGDGLWALPNSILALAGVEPPICMKFLSKADNKRVDAFL